ncbi:MAG: RidA family protein [Acidobacteriaceae bacterium]
MREYVNLDSRRPSLPFSDAVEVGGTIYLSGRIGFVPGTTRVPDDPAEEARNLLDGFAAVLKTAGLAMQHLVSVQIFTPDVALFQLFNSVYVSYFPQGASLPARAFLGSGPLLFGARFEMIGIAHRDLSI